MTLILLLFITLLLVVQFWETTRGLMALTIGLLALGGIVFGVVALLVVLFFFA
jgi:hypothetical protein